MKFFKSKSADPQKATPAETSDVLAAPVSPPAASPADIDERETAGPGFFGRLKRGLGRTSDSLAAGFGNLFLGRKTIDADLLEELESQLLMADVGIEATSDIIAHLTERVSRKELSDPQALMQGLGRSCTASWRPAKPTLM